MIIGCNGWDAAAPDAGHTATQTAAGIPSSWWVSSLGKPLGPPATANGVVSRSFESGVRVRYDLTGKNETIDGWEALPAPPVPTAARPTNTDPSTAGVLRRAAGRLRDRPARY